MRITKRQNTILYLSGCSFPIENYVRDRGMRNVGILLSYAEIRKKSTTWQRLRDIEDQIKKERDE